MGINLGSAFGKVNIDVSGVASAKRSAGQSLQSMESSFLSIAAPVAAAQAAVELFAAAARKIGDVIESVAEGMVSGNAQFEQYETSFKVLIGNAELAKERMEELADFGKRTPFELPGVVEADRVLQSFGLHGAAVTEHFRQMNIDIRTLTGDVAAGVGVDMKQIAGYIGRFSAGATGEAIMRFQELGIVTRDELRAMGVEFSKSNELVSPLPEAMDALLMLMQEKFGGMMDAQSMTFGGMLSNLVDWKDNALRELGEPIFDILKEGLAGLLELLDSDAVNNTLGQFTDLMRNSLNIAMDFIRGLTGTTDLQAWFDSFAGGLQKVNSFLTELRDRLRGFTVADVMAELADSIEDVQDRLDESLKELETSYERTVTQINAQIENATAKLADDIADITEKYGEKALKVEERFAETRKRIEQQLVDAKIGFEEQILSKRESLQQRLEDMERSYAERRRSINEQIQDKIFSHEERLLSIRERLEDQLYSLRDSHRSRQNRLSEQLAKATTESERSEILARMQEEKDAFKKQRKRLKDRAKREEERENRKHDRAIKKLKDRLKREEKAYQESVARAKQREAEEEARLKQKYDRQVAKLNQRLADEDAKRRKQLEKIFAERDEEIAKTQAAYDQEVQLLQERLDAEAEAYRDNREKIAAAAQEDIKELEADAAARAAALSQEASGAMQQVLDVVDRIGAAIDKMRELLDAVREHWAAIKSALIAIGAVLAGAGVLGAISATAAAVAALATPLGAIIAAATLLGVAWGENWFGIQEKTKSALENLRPYWESLKAILSNFKDQILPALSEAWQALSDTWSYMLQPALAALGEAWNALIVAFGGSPDTIDLLKISLGALKLILDGVVLAVKLVTLNIQFWGTVITLAIEQATAFVENLVIVKDSLSDVVEWLGEAITKMIEFGSLMGGLTMPGLPSLNLDIIPQELQQRIGQIAGAGFNSLLPAPAAAATQSISNSTGPFEINIFESDNPVATGQEVHRELEKIFDLAQGQPF